MILVCDEILALKIDRFNNILVPLCDIHGKFWSLQRISPNGDRIIGVIKTKEEKQENKKFSARKKVAFIRKFQLKNTKSLSFVKALLLL